MIADEIDHAHDTIATSHTHIRLHAISTALVDRHQVLYLVNRVVNHFRRNHLVLTEEFQTRALKGCGVLRQVTIETAQLIDLPLQIEVAEHKLLVHPAIVEV